MDYEEAMRVVATARDKRSKPIANNTRMEKRGNSVAVRFHSTDVMTFWPDGSVEISTGGWNTVTTRGRINDYLPSRWRLWSNRVRGSSELWLHRVRDGVWPVLPFEDGMTVTRDGDITMHGVVMTDDEITDECERLRAAAVAYDAKRAERLITQHEKGAKSAFGMVKMWGEAEAKVRFHPRSWDGKSRSCPSCRA